MTSARFEITYDGEAVQAHAMDLHQLAPALLALGDLIRDANSQINGEGSKVKVLIQSDFEHKCFNVGFEVIQTVLGQIVALLQDDKIKSAKDILEWIGLIVGAPGATIGVSVIAYLRWKKGRSKADVTEIRDTTTTGDVTLRAGDGNQITVNQTIYNIAENPRIKKNIAALIAPVEATGISEFRSGMPGQPGLVLDKPDVADIRAACAASSTAEGNDDEVAYEPQSIVAHLRVHSPVFDADAPRWRFRYGEETIYADITETPIAANAIARGGVWIDDLYKVRLEITEHETGARQFRKSYKVLQVLEFVPAAQQTTLFDWSPPTGSRT